MNEDLPWLECLQQQWTVEKPLCHKQHIWHTVLQAPRGFFILFWEKQTFRGEKKSYHTSLYNSLVCLFPADQCRRWLYWRWGDWCSFLCRPWPTETGQDGRTPPPERNSSRGSPVRYAAHTPAHTHCRTCWWNRMGVWKHFVQHTVAAWKISFNTAKHKQNVKALLFFTHAVWREIFT